MKTQAQVLTALRMSGREFIEACRAMPPEQYDAGRYENGWTARQILAHVASIEWTYPKLITLAARPAVDAGARTGEQRAAPRGLSDYNTVQVEKRANATVPELIAEFERNRQRTIAAVEAAEAELFARQLTSAGGLRGSLGELLIAIGAGHTRTHLADILGD